MLEIKVGLSVVCVYDLSMIPVGVFSPIVPVSPQPAFTVTFVYTGRLEGGQTAWMYE